MGRRPTILIPYQENLKVSGKRNMKRTTTSLPNPRPSMVIGGGYFLVNNILNVVDQVFPGLVYYDTIQ